MTRPSVLIVDDHAAFRALARKVLTRSGFDVIGEAADGEDALTAAERINPQVVVLDVQLPGINGFEVARRLLAGSLPPAVVLVSTADAADYGRRIGESGAIGFITKSHLSGDTLHAILRGETEAGKMTATLSRTLGAILTVAAIVAACSGTPGSSSAVPASQAPSAVASEPASAAAIPADFPFGSWTTTITEDDLRAGGLTGEGLQAENAGVFTLTMAEDGTWTTAQVSDVPLRWPVFKGTWTATGPDGFSQLTTFPTDFAGDVVDFTWKIVNGSLILKVVTPPDPVLPVVMESHPWQPAG
jgi:CheY-like chemotaxis protein